MTHACAVGPEDLGPYLLGHLSRHEATRVEAALRSCARCRDEVDSLRSTVALMAAAPTNGIELSVPPVSLGRVLGAVDRRRRGRRAALAAAAAAAVAVGALAGTSLVGGSHGPAPARSEVIQLQNASGASARVLLGQRAWGTALSLEVRGLDPLRTYGAWLAGRDGHRVPAGTFRPDARGWAQLELGAALRRSDSASIGLTALGGTDVLQTSLRSG